MVVARKVSIAGLTEEECVLTPTYASRHFAASVPRYRVPDKMMPADVAYQIIHDELNLDGTTAFDLGSFTTTWMEPEAEKLIIENLGKNFIDHFEYPQTTEIHQRIVNMLARLFKAPEAAEFCGTATIGSSEAIELGLLAHKWTWKDRRKKQGKPFDRPNLVYSAAAHVCWDKFARYFDVEARKIEMTGDRFIIDPKLVPDLVDENTICVGAIIGTTYTGASEPVGELNEVLADIQRRKGWDIPIHVDAASGGFIYPFTNPNLEWDFRLPHVRSINVSGHKFGLVYPGLGWLIFKEEQDLPKDLIFYVNYLGETMPTYTLNFSRGSDTVLAQYYNLLRLGHEGYSLIMGNCMANARYLAEALVGSRKFEIVSPLDLPIVAFRFAEKPPFTPFQLSQKLRERGWMLPAYKLPIDGADKDPRYTVMRVVVRESFSRDMAENLTTDLLQAYKSLDGVAPESLEPSQECREALAI